jgi:hypothetical protein
MLWDWTGKDNRGRVREYQTDGPDYGADSIMRHLRQHYPNLEITNIKKAVAFKPSTGIVERHAFQHGIMEAVERELGLIPNSPEIKKRSESLMRTARTMPLDSLLSIRKTLPQSLIRV